MSSWPARELITNLFLEVSFIAILSFHPISLISSLNSHNYSCFPQTCTFVCCFSVSSIVSSASMYAGVTHELGTFPLRLREMHLSPVTATTFLLAFVLAVILIVTKTINLVDLHWENAASYGEFINCNTQRYMLWSYWLTLTPHHLC